jgi:hypothetical protein
MKQKDVEVIEIHLKVQNVYLGSGLHLYKKIIHEIEARNF